MQAPSRAFSLVLKGRCGHLGVGGSELEKLAPGPGSSEARGRKSRGWDRQSGGDLQAEQREHLQALFESRSWEKPKLVDRLRGARALNLPRALPRGGAGGAGGGGAQPLGGAPSEASRAEGAGDPGRCGRVKTL